MLKHNAHIQNIKFNTCMDKIKILTQNITTFISKYEKNNELRDNSTQQNAWQCEHDLK